MGGFTFVPFSQRQGIASGPSDEPLGGSPGPLAIKRPQTLESFNRKWEPAMGMLEAQGIPREVWAPIMEIDLQRASSGQNVLSANETLLALRSAQTHQAVQEQPKGNLIDRSLKDVRQIVSAVPKMPAMFANEAKEIAEGETLKQVAEGIQNRDMGAIADAPGIRMIPGSYTVSNLAHGNSPLDRPVMSLLDLMPVASQGAKFLPRVGPAREALLAEGQLGKARPLRTAAREYVSKPWMERVENMTGRPYEGLLTKFGLSGKRQGELARQVNIAGRYGDEVGKQIYAEFEAIKTRRQIDPAREALITEAAQTGRLGELTPNEQMYVEEMRALNDRINTSEGLRRNEEAPKEGIVEIDGEFYEGKSPLPGKVRGFDRTVRSNERGIEKLAPKVEKMEIGIGMLEEVIEKNHLWHPSTTGEGGYFRTSDGRVSSISDQVLTDEWALSQGYDVAGPDAVAKMVEVLGEPQRRMTLDRLHDLEIEQSLNDVYAGDISREVLEAGEVVPKQKARKQYVDIAGIAYEPGSMDTRAVLIQAMQGEGPLQGIFEADTGVNASLSVAEAPLVEWPVQPNGMAGDPVATQYFYDNYDVLRNSLEDALSEYRPRVQRRLMGIFDEIPRLGATNQADEVLRVMRNDVYRKAKTPAKSIQRAIERGRYAEAGKFASRLTKKLYDLYKETGVREVLTEARKWDQRAAELDWAGQFIQVRKTIRDKGKNLPKYEEALAKKKANMEEARLGRVEAIAKAPPARYEPLIREQVVREMKAKVATDEPLRTRIEKAGAQPDQIDWAEVTIRMEEQRPREVPGIPEAEWSAMTREVRENWMDIKAVTGTPPVFVHALDLGQVQALNRPMKALAKQEITPTSFRGRTGDPKPVVKNLEIAMKHQAREMIQQTVDRQVRDWVTTESGWAKTGEQIYSEYELMAQRMIESGYQLPPGTTIGSVVDELINNDMVAWNPKSLTPLTKGHYTRSNKATMYVPKWLAKTYDDMYPQSRSALGKGLTKVHNVFRTSILPLSPRFHINNIIGGAVMLTVEGGVGVWKHLDAARQMLKQGELPLEISRGAGMGEAADASWGLATGAEMGKVFQNDVANSLRTTGKALGGKITKATDTSYAVGEYVDQLYRAMAMIDGKTKAQRMGLGPNAARKAGIEEANRILQDWDAYTPVERSVIRQIFPFYGWMKHIMRFTLSMPFDHPVRTAIMSNFARNEWEDYGTGIPERFFQMFVLGKPDANGTIKANMGLDPTEWSGAFNMSGTNPFSDVANYMTLAGFVGQLSPVGSGFLEAMGINSATGTANLYPDTAYDAVLGRNVAKGPNVGLSILRNVVPQFDFVMDAIGMTPAELRNLKINDPDLYNQRILSSIGIPFIPRDLNFQREAALAEVARNKDAISAFNRALRTGDWSKARQYPEIGPLLSILEQVPRSQIDPLLLGERPKLAS